MSTYHYLSTEVLDVQSMSDEGLKRALLESFISSFPGLVDKTQKALDEGDWKNVSAALHQLKASSGIFGTRELFNRVSLLYQTLNDISEDQRSKEVAGVLDQLRSLISEVRDYVNSIS